MLQPLYQKIDEIIKSISEKEGFDVIYDLGQMGHLFYYKSENDLTQKVKAALGL